MKVTMETSDSWKSDQSVQIRGVRALKEALVSIGQEIPVVHAKSTAKLINNVKIINFIATRIKVVIHKYILTPRPGNFPVLLCMYDLQTLVVKIEGKILSGCKYISIHSG